MTYRVRGWRRGREYRWPFRVPSPTVLRPHPTLSSPNRAQEARATRARHGGSPTAEVHRIPCRRAEIELS